jgi:hypothetical protein
VVEPLQVVDRDDRRPALGLPAQRRQHRAPARERVVLGEQRRGIEPRVLEQVDECGEAARHLLLGRARAQHREAGAGAQVDRLAPQRRLADPRLAADQQRSRAAGQRTGEPRTRSRSGSRPTSRAPRPVAGPASWLTGRVTTTCSARPATTRSAAAPATIR